jgi:small subunit ribosomal protein S17
MIGRVVSVKMQNTAVVLVESTKTHPLYKKSYKRSKKFLVEDLIGVKPGDIVDIIKVRPISKLKHWKIEKVVGRNIEAIVAEELKEKAAAAIEEGMPEVKEKAVKESVEPDESSVSAKASADKKDSKAEKQTAKPKTKKEVKKS